MLTIQLRAQRRALRIRLPLISLNRAGRIACFNGRVTDRVDAWVRATCEICGNVRVRIAEVRLVMAGADRGGDRRNLVEFACPVCGLVCSKRVDERTTRLLTAAGVDWS